MKKPKLIIVDDNITFRQGLKFLITVENIGKLVGEASNGPECLELMSRVKPDLALIDIDMPQINGSEVARKALEILPGLKIIAFSMFGEHGNYRSMFDLGINGLILKTSGINEIEKAIKVVMTGRRYFSDEFVRKLRNNPGILRAPSVLL